jgi:hypothetical protein
MKVRRNNVFADLPALRVSGLASWQVGKLASWLFGNSFWRNMCMVFHYNGIECFYQSGCRLKKYRLKSAALTPI